MCTWQKKKIIDVNTVMLDTVTNCKVPKKMSKFDKANEKKPIFKVMCNYMRMVIEMLYSCALFDLETDNFIF